MAYDFLNTTTYDAENNGDLFNYIASQSLANAGAGLYNLDNADPDLIEITGANDMNYQQPELDGTQSDLEEQPQQSQEEDDFFKEPDEKVDLDLINSMFDNSDEDNEDLRQQVQQLQAQISHPPTTRYHVEDDNDEDDDSGRTYQPNGKVTPRIWQYGGQPSKYQFGGRTNTIYTSDPNDPRLKSYRDSANLHDIYSRYANIQKKRVEAGDTLDIQGYPTTSSPNIQPSSWLEINGPSGRSTVPQYKAPVQPVVFRDLKSSVVKDSSGYVSDRTGRYKYINDDPRNQAHMPLRDYTPEGQYSASIPQPQYHPMGLQQKPTNYSATYRDEYSPSKQSTIYFKTKQEWQNFMNSGALGNYDTSESENSARVTGYRRMQSGGTLYANDKQSQHVGLNNQNYERAILNLKGSNTIRGLDNHQPVYVTDGSKYRILRGPNDTDTFNGKVYEKRMQTGGEADAKQFYTNYLKSPNYTKRLQVQGYTNPAKVVKDRLNNMKSTGYVELDDIDSQYSPNNRAVIISPSQLSKYNLPKQSSVVHEYSHASGSTEMGYMNNPNLNMNAQEVKAFQDRNKLSKIPKEQLFKMSSDDLLDLYHDKKSSESKSDLDALRYQLLKDKIYNTGTQKFTPEHLKQAKEKYKDNNVINRLFKNFSDKDLIYLMNNIASNNPNTSPYA